MIFIYTRISINYNLYQKWHKADKYDEGYYLRIYKMKLIDYSDNELKTYIQTYHVY